MSEFKLPHVEDLTTNSKLPGQLTENFKAIEQEDKEDDQALSDEVADRKEGDDTEKAARQSADDAEKAARQSADDGLEKRIKKLEDNSATHDDVNGLRKEMYQIRDDWHDRASHIARGTDIETTKAVVEQILQEKGLI